MITQSQIVYLLASAQVIFTEKQATKELVLIWHRLFKNEDFILFEKAFTAVLKESAFFPRPDQVEKNLRTMKEINQVSLAEKAWAVVMQAASTNDQSTSARLMNLCYPARIALRAITFDEIRLCNVENELPWKRKEFLRIFNETLHAENKFKHLELSQHEITYLEQLKKCTKTELRKLENT